MAAPSSPNAAARVSLVQALKLKELTLEKDAWENVPGLIVKSFMLLSTNMGKIQNWAAKVEDRAKLGVEQQGQMDHRIDAVEASIEATNHRLEELAESINRISEDTQQSFGLLDCCMGTLLKTTRLLLMNFGQGFGFDFSWSAEEEAAFEARQRGEAGLDTLRVLSDGLEAQLEALDETFGRWASWRVAQERSQEAMQVTIEELSVAAERTRERLLTWREMLKENSHVIGSLGKSLANTQGTVQELQATQVKHHDVDEAIARQGQKLEALLQQMDRRVDGNADCIDAHTVEIGKLIQEVRRETDDQMEQNNIRVSQLLERSLNPVNAYLNTMHVKSDAVRMELNILNEKVPKLAFGIEGLASDLKRFDDTASSRCTGLQHRLDKVVLSVAELGERSTTQHEQLSRAVEWSDKDLNRKISGVQSSLEQTASSLESAKKDELSALSKDLVLLEQKVAKWVQAQPLPAKMSEARLFSLEARLNEETDARLSIEHALRSARAAPRQSMNLPSLSHHGHSRVQHPHPPQLRA